ncbi:MAG TPA: hypothetical protein VIF09_04485, partial [Polyangiaceae bacterium]
GRDRDRVRALSPRMRYACEVDTPPVRPEYEALARDFRALAAQFDLGVDDALERDLVLVAAAFETIDRHVDATPDAAARGRLCAAILRALRDGTGEGAVRRELACTLAAVRARLVLASALGPFADQLARFFVRSERLRLTASGAEFVRCVLDEARCAAEMTLLAAPAIDVPRFARFFRVLSEIANLVDKLRDVRGDRARGEIAVRPGPVLHLRLLAAFAARVPLLLFLARRPLHLVAWGARYVLPATLTRRRAPSRWPA